MARPISKEVKTKVNIRTSYYHEYRQNDPNPEVDVKIYILIVTGFIKYLVGMIFSGRQVRIPDRLGIMGIKGRKKRPWVDHTGRVRGLCTDWKATNELWARDPEAKAANKRIFYFNEHSNGYGYKLHWYKKNMTVENKFNYYFKPSRTNKRMINKLIKNNAEFITN